MASVKTNIEQVASFVRGAAHAIDFDRKLPGGRDLGALLAEAIAVGIFKRSLGRQVTPEGEPFAPLSEAYLRYKVAHGYSPRKNVKTGKMLSLEEIRGTAQITPYRVDLTYGRTPETQQLAEWAEQGNAARNRPARPFYGLDPDIEAKLDGIIAAAAESIDDAR
jgi:hypothetical protein